MKKERTVLLETPVGVGTYYIDGQPVSASELCRRGEALDPRIRHIGRPGAIVVGELRDNGQLVGIHSLNIIPLPNPKPVDSYVATHEAAEVLRRHGHNVDNKPPTK